MKEAKRRNERVKLVYNTMFIKDVAYVPPYNDERRPDNIHPDSRDTRACERNTSDQH